MAIYELWQTRSRNLIGAFDTEAEALALVRSAAATHGPDFIETVLLGREDNKRHSKIVATGKELLDLAQRNGAKSS
jgi:hypothetical protein